MLTVLLPLVLLAQGVVQDAAVGLLDDRVHVDPAAGVVVDEVAVRDALSRSGESIFVAVLGPGGATARELAGDLAEQVRIDGTYVVLAGDDLAAASTVLEDGTTSDAVLRAQAAATGAGPTPLLAELVRQLDIAAAVSGRSTDPSGAGPPPWLLLALAPLFVATIAVRARVRQEDEAARGARAEDVRRRLRQDVDRLQREVEELRRRHGMHPGALADAEAAAERVDAAGRALHGSGSEASGAARLLEEARYAIARGRARAERRPPPGPPDVLRSPGRNGEPAVTLDPRGEPVYVGGTPFHAGRWFAPGAADPLLGDVVDDWGGPPR